jgi:hypothetical protein
LGLPAVTPTPPPPTVAPAIEPVTTTTASSGSPSGTSFTPAQGIDVTWASTALTITPTSLGAVKVGMTLAEAQYAAAVTFGNYSGGFASASSAGNPLLFVGGGVGIPSAPGTVGCVGAAVVAGKPASQVVTTAQGVHLGDSASRVTAAYGNAAHFVPAPASGSNPVAGYVVSQTAGNLAFVIKNDTVAEIEGGDASLQPSTCTG